IGGFLVLGQSADRDCDVHHLALAHELYWHGLADAVAATARGRLRMLSMGCPSNLRITSLSSMPAAAAGLSGETLATRAPAGSLSPMLVAISSVTFCTCTPSQPRRVSPYCLS